MAKHQVLGPPQKGTAPNTETVTLVEKVVEKDVSLTMTGESMGMLTVYLWTERASTHLLLRGGDPRRYYVMSVDLMERCCS